MPPHNAGFEPARNTQFLNWLASLPQALSTQTLQAVANEAYPCTCWRVFDTQGTSYMAMGALSANGDMAHYLDVQERLLAAGVRAPLCHARDDGLGFALLSDLGEQSLLPAVKQAQADGVAADPLMRPAFQSLVQMQAGAPTRGLALSSDAFIRSELDLFPLWCVQREHGMQWGDRERGYWEAINRALIQASAAQPQVLVHGDYRPSLLMQALTDGLFVGVLGFQGARHGPAGYDLMSLLRDQSISWDEAQELDWAVRYWEAARKAGVPWSGDFGECWRWMEWTALQRHLGLLGRIYQRKHQDGEPADADADADAVARLFAFSVKTATRYRELSPLLPLLEQVRPGVTQKAYG